MGIDDGSRGRTHGYSTETSPLIARPAAQGNDTHDNSSTDYYVPISNGNIDRPQKQATVHESEIESQSIEERQIRYEGLSEVKKNLKIIFPAVAIGVFLSAADQTLIVSSYGRIGSELNALSQTSWIATSYFLTLTSFQPLYGKLSDIFGRKSCLLFGYVVFGLGCLGCGLAENISQLVASRAFAGIGGSAMTTVVSILFSDICTLRERGQWQGYINIIYATGAAAGAPLGGVFADHLSWRWAFLAQVPLCVLAFIAVAFALRLPKNKNTEELGKRLRRIDFLGAVVLIGAVFTLLFAFDHGGNYSWTSPITLSSLGFSVGLWSLFLLVESKFAAEPFAPGHIIFNKSMVACYACNFFSMAGWLSTQFYVPLYFQLAEHVDATGAGARLIPSVIAGVLGSLFAGNYMRRSGRYYRLTIVSYTGLLLGVILIFLMSGPVFSNTLGIIVGMVIAGFGNGNGITTTLIGLIANASHEDVAVGTACSYLFRSLGSTFGVAMSSTVANLILRRELSTRLPAMGLPTEEAIEIAERVRESLAYLSKLPPNVRTVVESCFLRSTNSAFGLQIALIVGAAISAWFIREQRLSK